MNSLESNLTWDKFVWKLTLQNSLHTVKNDLAVSSKIVVCFWTPWTTISKSPLKNNNWMKQKL